MNSFQLVLRFDTLHCYYRVGWAAELPLGRFKHIDLVAETNSLVIIQTDKRLLSIYQQACVRATDLNKVILQKEIKTNRDLNWYVVPLNVDNNNIQIYPDEFGSFFQIATKTRYRLSRNCHAVWLVINNFSDKGILGVCARYPDKQLSALHYQIWKNRQQSRVLQSGGELLHGKLITGHSGLWFCADK